MRAISRNIEYDVIKFGYYGEKIQALIEIGRLIKPEYYLLDKEHATTTLSIKGKEYTSDELELREAYLIIKDGKPTDVVSEKEFKEMYFQTI